ncbi:hypothetical protein JCM8208_000878 [Rhodotorula glutinis]
MTSRRIPISSTTRQPQQGAAHAEGAIQSSLDLVWSFSRSAAFFGENLPSGPSFVDPSRFPRPLTHLDDTDDVDSSGRPTDRATTTDDNTDDDPDHDHDEPWSGDELDEGAHHAFDGLEQGGTAGGAAPSGREQLPPNAVGRGRTASRRVSTATQEHGQAGATWRDKPTADERTPLLPGGGLPSPSSSHLSPFDATEDSTIAYRDDGQEYAVHPAVAAVKAGGGRRRASTLPTSRAEWKAAIESHRGESTWGQTLFNTVNVLIGVGLLAEPLAFADAGWVGGMLLLVFCALVTNYTAKMLAAMMKQDRTSATYADVLIKAYGPWARETIYFLFVVELATFSVATVTLFADSMASLFPRFSSLFFKLISYLILLPTTYLPLRVLSLTSLLGIMSSVVLLAVLITDGLIKKTAPGSFWDPMATSIVPRWGRFPISFGLLMSGFSGHAVVPSLYRDMAHPEHFASMINVAYIIAFVVSVVFGVFGYLMFGNSVSSEITRDLASTVGYPVALNQLAVWMVAINPLVKYAIANKPLVTTFEHLVGLHKPVAAPPPPPAPTSSDSAIATGTSVSTLHHRASNSALSTSPSPTRRVLVAAAAAERRIHRVRYYLLRPAASLLCVGLAIAIPEFDRVLAFLGSASAFVICVIGPVGAYLIVGAQGKKDLERDGGASGYGGLETVREVATPPDEGDSPDGAGPGTGKNSVVAHARQVHAAELARRKRAAAFGGGAGGGRGGERLVVAGAERILCWFLLVLSIVMASVGTVWSFLPVEEAG